MRVIGEKKGLQHGASCYFSSSAADKDKSYLKSNGPIVLYHRESLKSNTKAENLD